MLFHVNNQCLLSEKGPICNNIESQRLSNSLMVKDTMNCPEKNMKISHFNPNQSAPSIYIMIELFLELFSTNER